MFSQTVGIEVEDAELQDLGLLDCAALEFQSGSWLVETHAVLAFRGMGIRVMKPSTIESVAFCAKANFTDEHAIRYSAIPLGRHAFPEICTLVLVRETGINQRNYCQGGRCHVLETLRNQWFTPAKAFWFSFQTNHRGFLTLGGSL